MVRLNGEMGKLNMAPITRRHFVRQTVFAAALYASPLGAIGESRPLFGADEQKGAPLDAETIRKLSANIVGHVITPDGSDYEAARLIFNRAFDRRPAVIVRCAGGSDVARTLDFARTKNLYSCGAGRRPQPDRIRDVRWRRGDRPLSNETS